jgi:hypothetical protein
MKAMEAYKRYLKIPTIGIRKLLSFKDKIPKDYLDK